MTDATKTDAAKTDESGPRRGHEEQGANDVNQHNNTPTGAKAPFAQPERDTLREWMSALCDGELEAQKETILVAAMEADETLFAEFAALAQVLPGASAPDDLADLVMAEISTDQVQDARLLMSQAMDGTLDASGEARLSALLAEAPAAATNFWHANEAVGAALDALAASPPVGLSEPALAVIADDVRAGELLSALLDNEASAADADAFVHLIAGEALGASDVAYRQQSLLSMVRTAEWTSAFVNEAQTHPEAQKAGAAALAAIAALERNAASTPTPAGPSRAPLSIVERLRRAFAPLAIAGGAAAAFFFVADMNPRAVTDGEDAPLFSPGVDDTRTLAMADTFAVLPDNRADVQALDAGNGSALIFNTEASNITVIWVTDPDDEIEGT